MQAPPAVNCLALVLVALGSLGCAASRVEPATPTVVQVQATAAPRTCSFGDEAQCRAACDGADAPSCNNLGAMVEAALVPEASEERAAELYAQACRGGAVAGCVNARRLASRRLEPAPPPPAPPAQVEPAAAPTVSLEEQRTQCMRGDRAACDILPGIHISGNVHIHGNVVMLGDVFLDGAATR